MLEAFARFAGKKPAWCGPDGFPLSWRYFVYGSQEIARTEAAEELKAASSARIAAHADADQYGKYLNDLRIAAGMTRA